MNEQAKTGEVIQFDANNIVAFDEFEAQILELEVENSKQIFDYADAKDNKEARSYIYKLRQSKSAIEKRRKDAGAAAQDYKRAVDARGKALIGRVEAMIEIHEKPIKELEEAEERRLATIQDRIRQLEAYERYSTDSGPDALREAVQTFKSMEVTEANFAEFVGEAAATKEVAVARLEELLEKALTAEAEKAELDKLRQEAEKREQQERQEAKRREEIDDRMDFLRLQNLQGSDTIRQHISDLNNVTINETDFGERVEEAESLRASTLETLAKWLKESIEREKQQEQQQYDTDANAAVSTLQNMALEAEEKEFPAQIDELLELAESIEGHPDWPVDLREKVGQTRQTVRAKLLREKERAQEAINKKLAAEAKVERENEERLSGEAQQSADNNRNRAIQSVYEVACLHIKDPDFAENVATDIVDAIIDNRVPGIKVDF